MSKSAMRTILNRCTCHDLQSTILCLFLLSGNLTPVATATPDKVSRRDIYIAGLFPFSGSEGHVGNGVKPAVDLALEHINNDSRILPHFNLKISYNDTK
ncbi:hypothetical protein BaRGS_00037057, partial [Batillaria attramentaria]